MNPLTILIVIACYFALLFLISYLAGRKADNAGFFSGNRSSNWLLVAMSTIGAAISGVTFVSVPGMVATSGWSYMQMVLGFTVGQIVIAYGQTSMPFGQAPKFDKEREQRREEDLQDFISICFLKKKVISS